MNTQNKKRINSLRNFTFKLIGLCVGGSIAACGKITPGTSTTPTDPVPSGVVVDQGQFFGQNGQTASGSAAIYLSNGTYTLHLSGVSFPTTSTLTIQIYANPYGLVSSASLRSYTGDQNYSFSVSANVTTFTSINIYSNTTQLNYAVAQLQ